MQAVHRFEFDDTRLSTVARRLDEADRSFRLAARLTLEWESWERSEAPEDEHTSASSVASVASFWRHLAIAYHLPSPFDPREELATVHGPLPRAVPPSRGGLRIVQAESGSLHLVTEAWGVLEDVFGSAPLTMVLNLAFVASLSRKGLHWILGRRKSNEPPLVIDGLPEALRVVQSLADDNRVFRFETHQDGTFVIDAE